MPDPNEYADEKEWMGACIPKVLDDGTAESQDQAVAICMSMWREKSADAKAILARLTAAKMGARNNANDRAVIREIGQHAKAIHDRTVDLEPDDEDREKEKEPMKAGAGTSPDAVALAYVKAAGDWELDVLGVPFGDPDHKDTDGEYFTDKTNTHSDTLKTPLVMFYHGYDKAGVPQGDPAVIGRVSKIWKDIKGWWYHVVLDKASRYAKQVWEAALKNEARASSGSIGHLVRKGRDGEIINWPVAELSVFDTREGRRPANNYAVALPAAKAHYQQAGIDLPLSDDDPQGAGLVTTKGVIDMDENEVSKLVAAELEKAEKARAAKAEAEKAEAEKIEAAVKAAREDEAKKWAAGNRLPVAGAPYVAKYGETWRYDNFTPGDLSFAAQVLPSCGKRPSANLLKALALKMENDKEAATSQHNREALKAAGIKADETDYTSNSSYGQDWVGTSYGTELWLTARAEANVAGKVPVGPDIPQGYSSNTIPLESTDPIFYKVPEATDSTYDSTTKFHDATVPPNAIGTSSKSITLGKMGARVIYSGEQEEDSLVAFAANARRQMGVCAAEAMDYVVINADSDASENTNINAIDTTPAATRVFLITNGFRKLALVTNTANSRSAAGSLDITDFVETLKLMGTAGKNAMAKEKVSFIVDLNTYWKALSLPEVLTRDVNSQATVENGALTRMYGVGVIPSGFFHGGLQDYPSTKLLSNTAGKVDADTEGNNLYGAILAVRWDQWQMRYKRRWTLEMVRRPESDTNEIVGLTRFGLGYRDNEASAITYYVGV